MDFIYVNDGSGGRYRKGQLGPIGQYTDGVDWYIEVRNLHNEVIDLTGFNTITAAMTDRESGAVTVLTGSMIAYGVATNGIIRWTIPEADSDVGGLYDVVFTLTDGTITYISLPVFMEITENTPPIFVGAYDAIPNLAYIWEPRRTLASYTGPLGQLRRTTDGGLMDFYSTDMGHFDKALAAQWLGASTAFWRTLYEQKGSGNNLVQITNSRQPLYNANINNGRPGLEQTSTAQGMIDITAPITQPATIYIAGKMAAAAVNDGVSNILAGASNNLSFLYDNSAHTPDKFEVQAGAALTGPNADSIWRLWTFNLNGASSSFRMNGAQVAAGNAGTNNYTGVVLGNLAAFTLGWRGYIAAMIVADPNHDAGQIATMEAAINAYWGIY